METIELLQAYTKANDAAWAARDEKLRIEALLENTVKQQTRALRAAVGRVVRGTGWACDKAKYITIIRHASRPVEYIVSGRIEVSRVDGTGRGNAFMRYEFSPVAEADVLDELRRLVCRPAALAPGPRIHG